MGEKRQAKQKTAAYGGTSKSGGPSRPWRHSTSGGTARAAYIGAGATCWAPSSDTSRRSGPNVRRTGSLPAGRPLRSRALVAIVGVAASAVVLFAIPLGIALQRLYRDEAIVSLERDATRISAAVPDDIAG